MPVKIWILETDPVEAAHHLSALVGPRGVETTLYTDLAAVRAASGAPDVCCASNTFPEHFSVLDELWARNPRMSGFILQKIEHSDLAKIPAESPYLALRKQLAENLAETGRAHVLFQLDAPSGPAPAQLGEIGL